MRFALLSLLAFACSSSSPSPTPTTAGGLAPPPFTPEQIRDATKSGRTYTWKVSGEGRTFVRKLRFVEVDAEKATTESTNVGDDGSAMGQPELKTSTWEDFVKHAAWPQNGTVITDARITVGAGEFDCMLYTVNEVRDGKKMVTRAWFARNLPGAPVKLVVEIEGTEVTSLELLAHEAGI